MNFKLFGLFKALELKDKWQNEHRGRDRMQIMDNLLG